jgi:signal transduction histidine kinase
MKYFKDNLNRIFKTWLEHPFKALHLRLLLSYLSVMSTVLGVTVLFVYQYFASNLYSKFDRQIAILADAASHSLPKLKDNPNLIQKDVIKRDRMIDNDGDLDIPWQDMRQSQQTIEWFDADGKLLAKAGNQKVPSLPFSPINQASFIAKVQQLEEYHDLRSLIVPIYLEGALAETIFSESAEKYNQKHSQRYDEERKEHPERAQKRYSVIDNNAEKVLIGYVRVSESSGELEEELEKLLWGLGWGGLLAIALSGAGGWWLAWQALQPIERNYEQMRQFTADASHELRSPLTAIKTSIEVIQSHPERIHEADVKKLAAIGHATAQMTHLVEDLLFLARVDNASLENTGDRSANLLLIPLDELLEDLLEFLEPQIIAKEINIQSHLHDAVSIRGEASQLRRLFINLLENAIAYTPTGGKITVDLQQRDRSILVAITDTGLGIAPEDLPHIFERFWRADRARSWRAGGSGLGLAIAEAIAKNHDGNITVSSQIGSGSCFTVTFA